MHLLWYHDWWRKTDVHDLLEAVLTSKVAQMAYLSPNSHVNTWDMVLKAILHLLGLAHTKLGGLVEKN